MHKEERTGEYKLEPTEVLQVGDLYLSSSSVSIQELSTLMKELLSDKTIQKYLGLFSKNKLTQLGSMFQ